MGDVIKFQPRNENERPQKKSEKNPGESLDTRRAYLFERKKSFKDFVKTVADELGTFQQVLKENVIEKNKVEWKENIRELYKALKNLKTAAESHMEDLGENDLDRHRLELIINRISFVHSVLNADIENSRMVLISIKQLKAFLQKE